MEEDVYPIKNTVEDILWDTKKDIHECIYETDYAGLDIIPSFITLSNMENQLIIDITEPNQFRLYKQLAKVDKEYDYCLIDCGPSVSLLNANALAASDVVYIPSRCDRNSRIGIANVLRLVHNVQDYSRKELRFGGCFLTQYDSRKKICQEAVKDCGDAFGKLLLPITIPVCTKMEQASSARKPILEIEPKGNATRSYLELAELLVQESKDR